MAVPTTDRTPVFLDRDKPLKPDLVLVITYLVISAIGLLMVYSATAPGLDGPRKRSDERAEGAGNLRGHRVHRVRCDVVDRPD